MIKLPTQSGKWRVSHGQDGFTDIIDTRNVNFDKNGTLALAKQPVTLYTSTQDSTFSTLMAITYVSGVYTLVTTNKVFTYTASTGAVAAVSNTSMTTHGIYSDSVYYNQATHISCDTTTEYFNGTWNTAVVGLTTGVPHPMAVFENRNTLCVGNANQVFQTLTASNGADSSNTLTLPANFIVTGLRYRGNNMYIFTRSTTAENAKMFIWNGQGTGVQQGFSVHSDWAYSACDWRDSIVVVNSVGQGLRFNGGGFTEIFHFPVYETGLSWSSNAASNSLNGKIPNRGMVSVGDNIYMNVDGSIQDGLEGYPGKYLHNQPSGLWVYDPEIGLYHKAGGTYTQVQTITATTLSSDVITFGTTEHNCETGDEIRAVSVSNITGLTAGRDYFAIKVSSTSMKLAFSPADALAGRSITLSGTPSGDTFNTNTLEVGATSNYLPGAVVAGARTTSQRFFGEEVLWGAQVNNNANTGVKSFMSFGTGRNVGSFTTTFLPSAGITDAFQKLYTKCLTLLRTTDSIRIKYRVDYKPGLPTPARFSDTGLATWTDNQTFTILNTAKDVKSASVGDEVSIVEGAGAGYTAHITAIDTTTSTYSFTLDEAIPTVIPGDTSEIMVDNWAYLDSITSETNTLDLGFGETGVAKKNSAIQFKVEMRGKDINIQELTSINTISKSTV